MVFGSRTRRRFHRVVTVEDNLCLPLVGGLSVHRPERVGDAIWRESRVCADGSVDRYRSDVDLDQRAEAFRFLVRN